MTTRQLTEMTRAEVRAAAPSAIAVLPIGSQEQHREHLPMGTDTFLVEAVLAEATAGHSSNLVLLPSLPYGYSDHHLFSAAVSLSPRTHLAVLSDVLASLSESGFRRIMVVNGHGGNQETMSLAIKHHALTHKDVTIGACSYWLVAPDDAGDPAAKVEEPSLTPGHAGWFETSLMLVAKPELVRRNLMHYESVEPAPVFDKPLYPGLQTERSGEWGRVDGGTDTAKSATAEAGHALLARRACGLANAISAFDKATSSGNSIAYDEKDDTTA
ncbi:creatininase family protein [Spelaeicoccus albus]|uniref:Creatinine amidohydrolase n=1 Tax=Spelaeicoccus albus TaxID=1280376 RepID=A0A7Z0ABG6_9MICO|nr:creatininase family protein [Spelaeicoccus albus]NYI67050.1 creatinine amidohydrolase [Spelaeicoccus albus]